MAVTFYCNPFNPVCGICDNCCEKITKTKKKTRSKTKYSDRLRKKAHKKKKQVKEIHGKMCYICEVKIGTTIDHVIPLSKGGTNDIMNLRMACYDCNYEKADKILPGYGFPSP